MALRSSGLLVWHGRKTQGDSWNCSVDYLTISPYETLWDADREREPDEMEAM